MSIGVVLKRVNKEIQALKDDHLFVKQGKTNDDIIWVIAKIRGPEDSPFRNGIYLVKFLINLTTFPFKPPEAVMLSNIFHPNFSQSNICIDILKDQWSSALSLFSIVKSLENLLTDPNPDSPLNSDAASMLMDDPCAYEEMNQIIVAENAVEQAYELEYD